MEITNTMKQLECKKCGKVLSATFTFCPFCGARDQTYRSENEVRAKIEQLKALKPAGLGSIVSLMVIIIALEWVLGGNLDPAEIANPNKQKESTGG